MIFGPPGSGKSTFAPLLSKQLGLPLFHLDTYRFTKNWNTTDYDEFLKKQEAIVEKEYWIIDGNDLNSLELRFCRADVAIYLRFNRLLCLWRMIKRVIYHDPHIADLPKGCSKNIKWFLLIHLWNFHRKAKSLIKTLRKTYPSVQFYEVHNDQEVLFLRKFVFPKKEDP
jgi:adenylate kinase family enzyme